MIFFTDMKIHDDFVVAVDVIVLNYQNRYIDDDVDGAEGTVNLTLSRERFCCEFFYHKVWYEWQVIKDEYIQQAIKR